jgi:hypothetical protein
MRGKTREKIRIAPEESGKKTQQNSHDGSGGLAGFGGFAFFRFEAENGHDFLQIFPDFAFGAGIAQQIGWVISGHQFSTAKFEPLAAELGNAACGFKEGLCGASAESNDHSRIDGIELAQQEWRTGSDFVFFRETVLRRAAFDDVADVNIFALQAHGFDHLREKFTGAADEGEALKIFIMAGAFADKDEFGFRTAVAEDNFVAGLVKFAAGAFAEVGANF